jgi:hypothetical protein
MDRLHVYILLLVFPVIGAPAEENDAPGYATSNSLPFTITVDGISYSNVLLRAISTGEVSITHATGAATIPLEKLPPALQKRLGYDPQKADGIRHTETEQTAEMQAAEVQAAQKRGRIGETRAQIDARYGRPTQITDDGSCIYLKGGFRIMVAFYQNKAELIIFGKDEKDALDNSVEMSDNEIQTLLKACGGEKQWKPIKEISMNKQWQTENASIMAQYDVIKQTLGVLSKGYIERFDSKKKSEEDKNLQGF